MFDYYLAPYVALSYVKHLAHVVKSKFDLENETYKECLKREFKEESGYEIVSIKEFVCIDCFWLAMGKYKMESKANIFIVEVNLNNVSAPSEEGCICKWVEENEILDKLPLPYHKKAIEYFIDETK